MRALTGTVMVALALSLTACGSDGEVSVGASSSSSSSSASDSSSTSSTGTSGTGSSTSSSTSSDVSTGTSATSSTAAAPGAGQKQVRAHSGDFTLFVPQAAMDVRQQMAGKVTGGQHALDLAQLLYPDSGTNVNVLSMAHSEKEVSDAMAAGVCAGNASNFTAPAKSTLPERQLDGATAKGCRVSGKQEGKDVVNEVYAAVRGGRVYVITFWALKEKTTELDTAREIVLPHWKWKS